MPRHRRPASRPQYARWLQHFQWTEVTERLLGYVVAVVTVIIVLAVLSD